MPFERGDYVMWESEDGLIGPLKILARHGKDASYDLDLSDLEKAGGLESTVARYKLRKCTEEEKRTVSMRSEAGHVQDAQDFGRLDGEEHDQGSGDVDMQDSLDDVPPNPTASGDQERGDSDDGATNTPMDDDAGMGDGRGPPEEVSPSEDDSEPRNNTRSRFRAEGQHPEMLHKGQSSDPASSHTSVRGREQAAKPSLELSNDDSPPNDLTPSSSMAQDSPAHRRMTDTRKGQAERRETATKETTPRSRRTRASEKQRPSDLTSPPRNDGTPEHPTGPSPAEEHEEWTIVDSKFNSATPVPSTTMKGVVTYKVKKPSGVKFSIPHTKLPENRIRDFQEWHVNLKKKRTAPEAWETDIERLRRERDSDQDSMGEDDEEDVDEGNGEDEKGE
ncbi:hypothetical protein FB567DRAFT_612766 [Paraphoma chrysanthemicola]|uniref:Uncharacterized protein n=1 Tax=Paraphoma chrysanthemicola TaxID=798071 RepID=A0A8K0QU21_9PLEO|nr:hypothetical protein FB567DRAFT_612766 [Paraphoma chrysanthemicola]